MREISNVIFIVLLCISVSACSKSAPKCEDKRTKDLVYKIASERYVSDNNVKHSFDLIDIINDGIDKETGKCSCKGKLSHKITFSDKNNFARNQLEMACKMDPSQSKLIMLDDMNFIVPLNINYVSELTTDGKHYVTILNGLE